ncbi:hypothetical protein EXS71_03255 [Candidatus Uhrbacteria bacterium]|nr:hypothetical protein [Candidatus Uhrbacteria bacterium]
MTKPSTKQPEEKKPVEIKALIKPTPSDEIKKFIKEIEFGCDPRLLLKQAGKAHAELVASPQYDKKLADNLQKEMEAVVPMLTIDNHYLAAEVVGERYRSFLMHFANELVEEYQCQTPSEKSLAQHVASCYVRILELSKRATAAARLDSVTQVTTSYYAMISKELDRAHRQFTSSLLVLKQMKSPNMEVNIKAKTAFISQNQQINANTQQNPTSPDSSSFNV